MSSPAPDEILKQYAKACSVAGAPAKLHADFAELLRQAGRLDEAEAAIRRALALDPAAAQAWNTLGAVQMQMGAVEAGRASFAEAIRLDSGMVKALNNLAVALQHLGRWAEADDCYAQVVTLLPDHTGVLLNRAVLKALLGEAEAALFLVERALAIDARLTPAMLLASDIERDREATFEALAWVDRALAVDPNLVEALGRRANLCGRLGRHAEALEACDRGLAAAPGDADCLYLRAQALQGLDRTDEALAAFDRAREAHPSPARVLTGKAIVLSELGRKPEALAALDEAIALEPRLAEAWYSRANLIRFPAGHPDLAAMAAIADDPQAPARDRMHMAFALGRALLDLGEGQEAFRRLDEGARLKRGMIRYDLAADARWTNRLEAVFDDAMLRQAVPGAAPVIFVVGMPRSGTTLIEQILASHPVVRGAGEPPYLAEIVEAPGFLDQVGAMSPEALADIGRRYLERLGVRPGERVVDKMPTNFRCAGAIPLVLPGARIIHCRRDALDTCLSCYSLLFTSGHEFSYDLAELGGFYRLYERLMAHWRRVLPPGALLEVDYEAIVREPEAQIRGMLDFCGLDWDEACLRFYETPRRVASASLDQVRSPLYASSIGRARQFRPWLGALEAALKGG